MPKISMIRQNLEFLNYLVFLKTSECTFVHIISREIPTIKYSNKNTYKLQIMLMYTDATSVHTYKTHHHKLHRSKWFRNWSFVCTLPKVYSWITIEMYMKMVAGELHFTRITKLITNISHIYKIIQPLESSHNHTVSGTRRSPEQRNQI